MNLIAQNNLSCVSGGTARIKPNSFDSIEQVEINSCYSRMRTTSLMALSGILASTMLGGLGIAVISPFTQYSREVNLSMFDAFLVGAVSSGVVSTSVGVGALLYDSINCQYS